MVAGLNIGKNALVVNQAALNVVSNNIANMNTEGYSKQKVNLVALTDNSVSGSMIQNTQHGYGVDLESITRYRDSFIDEYYRDSVSSKNYYDIITQNGLSLENFANEFNDTGLSTYIDEFFTAANNLSLYPTDSTMKINFVESAQTLVEEMSYLANQFNSVRTNLVGNIDDPTAIETCQAKTYTDEINQILNDIAEINKNVIYQYNTSTGSSTGLLDDRDILLDKLAEYIPVDVTENANGSITLKLGNSEILAGKEVKGEFKVNIGDNDNPCVVSFEDDEGYTYIKDVKSSLGKSGKLAAVLTLGGDDDTQLTVKGMLDSLDTMANAFAQAVNDIQLKTEAGPPSMTSAYYDPNTKQLAKVDATTDAIFVTSDGSATYTASNISINSNLLNEPYKVATAYVETDDAGDIVDPDAIGNNNTAQAFVDLRLTKLADLTGQTIEDFNTAITTDFGSKLNSANTNLTTQESVYEAAYEQRESTIGVNLDEELMDLVKYQRAYESSARVFTVANEILQTLVNLGL